jgi:hypothetical protein
MSGSASISGNIGGVSGGGVFMSGGSFTMSDNVSIRGNRIQNYQQGGIIVTGGGGGVCVSGGSFTKTGGIIYGKNEGTNSNNVFLGLGVVEQTDAGAAIYSDSSHRRETTVGATQNLSKSGSTYTGPWTD